MKIYLILILTFFLMACSVQQDVDPIPIIDDQIDEPIDQIQDFCGFSSIDQCNVDSDCMTTGCSNEICHGVISEEIVTDCEYKECYNAEIYGLRCGCFDGLCAWN